MLRTSPPPRFRFLLLLAVALAFCSSPAQCFRLPRPHKEAKQQIEELEQQWRAATLNADIPSMERLLSEDYVGILWNGDVNTKAMQLDRIRNRAFALTQLDRSDTKIKIVGNVAIVTARAEVSGTSEGVPIKGIFRYTRVYQRLPSGTWKITNFEVTRVPGPDDRPRHNHGGTS